MANANLKQCFINVPNNFIDTLDDEYCSQVLLVEDDDVDRERMARYLSQLKDDVHFIYAKSGQEALDYMLENPIDVLVVDYSLGDMTGYELLTHPEIYAEYGGSLSSVMVTGQEGVTVAVEAIKAGVIDYILKDQLSESLLVETIQKVLEQEKIKRQLQKTQAELERRSLYDSLTGLANRDLTFDRIRQAILHAKRTKEKFYLMLIDLNSFKEVNDTLGHFGGDEVLRKVSERMMNVLRESDVVGRLGGDEFVCLTQHINQPKDFEKVLSKFIKTFEQPVIVERRSVDIGAAIGIAQYPKDGADIYALMSSADHAMYRAKNSNQVYAFASSNKKHKSVNGLQLGKAIEQNALFMQYQPKINVLDNKIIGVEALIRCSEKDDNVLQPADFISVAERCNLIDKITDEVFRQVIEQNQEWQSQGIFIPISINISARLLDLPHWSEKVIQTFCKKGANPKDYVLEITETAIASSGHNALVTLHQLIEQGFKISIDDFGAGFTSFKFIHDVDVHEIKIDKVFIDELSPNCRGLEIIKSIVALAKGLGIHVIAEGVETKEQRDLILEAECHLAQGFLYSEAIDGQSIESFYQQYS